MWSHIARPKTSRTHAHFAHFSEWILHTHAHVPPHIARVRVRTHLRNSYLGNISENSPSDGRKLCRFVKKCHEHVINESITWTSSGIHPIDLCRFVLLSFWLRDRYCLKTFSDVLCPRNSLIKEFLFHGFGYAEKIFHWNFTLAISKFLCKENAGAILKPLLISNE